MLVPFALVAPVAGGVNVGVGVPVGVPVGVFVGVDVTVSVVTVTVQLNIAGDASIFPAASLALTWKVCRPSDKFPKLVGRTQAAKLPSSSLHSNWIASAPLSARMKSNTAELLMLGFDGLFMITVSGAVVSIVQLKLAGN